MSQIVLKYISSTLANKTKHQKTDISNITIYQHREKRIMTYVTINKKKKKYFKI
jgi:hypothetical protein